MTQHGIIVGRSRAVTGSLVITSHTITSGSFRVDLSQLTVYGKPNASFVQLLDTAKYPEATITLTTPIEALVLPSNGQTVTFPARGELTMRGVPHALSFTVTARSNGSVLEATGSASLLVSDWGVKSPFGVGKTAVIEFLVILGRG